MNPVGNPHSQPRLELRGELCTGGQSPAVEGRDPSMGQGQSQQIPAGTRPAPRANGQQRPGYLGRTNKPWGSTPVHSEGKDDIALGECWSPPDTQCPLASAIPLAALRKQRNPSLILPQRSVSTALLQELLIKTSKWFWVRKIKSQLTRHTTDLSNQTCSEGICEGRQMIH